MSDIPTHYANLDSDEGDDQECEGCGEKNKYCLCGTGHEWCEYGGKSPYEGHDDDEDEEEKEKKVEE